MKRILYIITAIVFAAVISGACSKFGDIVGDSEYGKETGAGTEGGNGGQGASAGVLTAGEWNDLSHWDFWGNLLNNKQFSDYQTFWDMYTDNRVAVKVQYPDGKPAIGVKVELSRKGEALWQSVTDNLGEAECWAGYFQRDSTIIQDSLSWASFSIALNGIAQSGAPVFSKSGYEASVNTYTLASAPAPENSADIAFIVDATGSMGDEIAFLKQDLMSILENVKDSTDVLLRTGAIFYRDKGDSYVTKASAFTDDISKTVTFISEQDAAGGGDYEEAVHLALEASLQDLAWKEGGKARLALLVFDAPAHQNHEGVVESLHASVLEYAKKGIKLIPVLASGGSKGAEFMGRLMAIATNGTYVFLTDDSGVGGEHIEASVGEYQVEKLNDLLVRILLDNLN